jgi:AAA domain
VCWDTTTTQKRSAHDEGWQGVALDAIELEQPTGNYATAVAAYAAAGWPGVLPLPARAKMPPPSGYTGANGRWPSEADTWDWRLHQPADCNVALRLPRSVIGLDIDQYDNRQGWDNLLDAAREHRLSPLAPTWRSSARPGPSGIYLFRVPDGTRLRGEAVPHVETIQHHHRFAVVWPSVHPGLVLPYRWSPPSKLHTVEGIVVPPVDALPALGLDWQEFLADATPLPLPADLPLPSAHREATWHSKVVAVFDAARRQLTSPTSPGSRHDIARDRAMALCRMEQTGLAGSTAALEQLGGLFEGIVAADRGNGEAAAEWHRIVDGGRRLAQSTVTAAEVAQRDERDGIRLLVPGDAPILPERRTEAVSEPPWFGARVDWPAFWQRERSDAEFLVEPLLARGRSHAVYASAKVGKSLLMLEVAAAHATGRAVLEEAPTAPASVVYVDMEMTDDDLHGRLVDLGYTDDDDLALLNYYLLPSLPPLDTAEGGVALEGICQRHQPALVVIDTTARVIEGEENSADTFRAFYRHTGSRLKRLGITYARLDHSGKDPTKGQRGSSAKADDVDVVWQLSPTGDGVQLRATHRRVNWVPEHLTLRRDLEPLRHIPVDTAYPTGTRELAARLDELEVPLYASRREAERMVREAGDKVRSTRINGALKWRRQNAETI